jgi:hypothetical protein
LLCSAELRRAPPCSAPPSAVLLLASSRALPWSASPLAVLCRVLLAVLRRALPRIPSCSAFSLAVLSGAQSLLPP